MLPQLRTRGAIKHQPPVPSSCSRQGEEHRAQSHSHHHTAIHPQPCAMGCWGTENVIWDLGEEGAALNLPPKGDAEDNLVHRNTTETASPAQQDARVWLRHDGSC